MTTPIGGAVPPAPHPHDTSQKQRLGLLAVVVVVIAGLVSAGLFLATRSDTADTPAFVYTDAPAEQPVFEARGARGDDPFFPVEAQVANFRAATEASTGQAFTDAEVQALDESLKTGLFGGTEENTCDPERLISFLYANPDLGEVWAGVHGIEFSEIASYVRSLEIRMLAESTNVLNHGFDPTTGGAYEIDSVLEAGTAVLVDADGNIRTRCYCGNPIKPKPPQHRPPRCIVFGAQVFTMPGGTTRIDDAPSAVVLTGQEANGSSGNWIEISWGVDSNQTGWVQSINLRKHHCPPPRDTGICPGPGPVGVYASPDTSSQVGELNGTVNQAAGAADVTAPISRVGAPDGVLVENGFVLIRFTQPAPSIQNSAWVQVSQLNADDCMPVPQCVNTEFAAKARAGGLDIRPAGVYKVEFTGHFTSDRSATEVRFLDGGDIGWITNFYTPLPWTDCEADPGVKPVVKCVRDQIGLEIVWDTATSADPTRAVGNIKNTPVTIVGDLTPTNGRVQIEMGAGGPLGWIDAAKLDGNSKYCMPTEVCVALNGPAWSRYQTDGVQLPGTPGGPQLVNAWSVYAIDAAELPATLHYLIEINGQTGWIDLDDIAVPADRTCGDEPNVKPLCPTSTTSDDNAAAIEKVGGSSELDELVAEAVGGEELRALPSSNNVDACCLSKAVFDSDAADNEQAVDEPVIVALSGANEAGTWYEIQTVYPGKWAPAVNFIDADECRGGDPTTPEGCGGFVPGTTFVPEDACCIGSKVLDEDGRSMGIDPPQFAEYVGSSDFETFVYEMRLVPEGTTVFAGPDNIAPIGLCGDGVTGVECPSIDGQDSQVGGEFAIVGRCCADLASTGLTVVNLEGTVDLGDGDDPLSFEYLTLNNGWMPGEVFVLGVMCTDANPATECPRLSGQNPTIGDAASLTCCAEVSVDTYSVVTLEGTIDLQDLDPFNHEYLTLENGWIQSEDFWDAERCTDEATAAAAPAAEASQPPPAAVADTPRPAPADPAPTDSGATSEPDEPVQSDPAPVDPCGGRDRDRDGICDNVDNCPDVPNPLQENSNRDLRGDACELVATCTDRSDGTGDRDGDGVCDQDDNCPSNPNPLQEDTYGVSAGDACENEDPCDGADKDDDKVCDKDDNCVGTPNPKQTNSYGDERGDACEEPCPRERTNGSECCKEGTFAVRGECYLPCPNGNELDIERNGCQTKCPDGTVVSQDKECPPECPRERQNPDTRGCCKEGTEYFHGECYVICKDGNPDLGDGCGPCRARGGDTDGDGVCDLDDK